MNTYPIYGGYKTSRGTRYRFTIYSDHTIECWTTRSVKCTGGNKLVDEFRPATKELKKFIEEYHGIVVK